MLSSDASISDIVLSDRDGPWLKIDKVRLIWNRLALFSRRLEVDQLTIGHMQFLRRPLSPGTAAAGTAVGSILPELPLKVIVKQFGLQELSLGEPVVGVAARLQIDGKATLGPPSEGLDLSLTSKRLDAPGEFKAVMTYVPATDKLTLAVNSDEPAGGIFAHLANLPGLPPVKLAFNGAGALDNFDAKLDFAAGRGRLGARRRRRRAAGRRAEAHARPQFPARGHGARDHPPGFRGRDDAQGRCLLQRRFDASRLPACTSSPPTPGSTSRAAGRRTTRWASRSTPARSRARRRSASSTSTPRSPGRP